jgi:DNA-directed RNA polymerase specialized sigma24 family protein
MAQYNPDFWEITATSEFIESVAAENALWFETEEDRERRYALQEFFQGVMPAVRDIIDARLTRRQREILNLYFFNNLTQEDIAARLDLTQSTVSRHLFGTVRNGKRVGGAIPKLRKAVEEECNAVIENALHRLQERFSRTAA